MPVIFAEGPCNTRCHAGNDDVDVIGIVRIILRDGREDVRSGGIQLHQVAGDRRILRVLSVQSFLDLFEGCNAVLQAISFRAQSWLDIRSIVIVELLKVSLGLFF